jgi:N-acetylmuramoyl-L-alanine amidase
MTAPVRTESAAPAVDASAPVTPRTRRHRAHGRGHGHAHVHAHVHGLGFGLGVGLGRHERPRPRHAAVAPSAPWWRSARLAAGAAIVVVIAAAAWLLVGAAPHGGPRGAAGNATPRISAATAAARARALEAAVAVRGVPVDPSLFEPGSCQSFPPTVGDRHQTVFLDAGHGGIDPGSVGTTEGGETIYEADETLPVELDTMALLRAQGYRVVVSRTGDSTVLRPGPGDVNGGIFTTEGAHNEVAARDICANMAKATVLVGIYFDAGASPTDAGSVTAYDAARPFSADNEQLATLVQQDVLARLDALGASIPDDGAVSDVSLGGPPLTAAAGDYGHLLLLGPAQPGFFTTPSLMPGALIEPLFITDPFEGTLAASGTGQLAMAQGLARAIGAYLAPPAPPRPSGPDRSAT